MDGAPSRLRFRKTPGASGSPLYQPEHLISNRDVPIAELQMIPAMAKRVLQYFSKGHMEVPWAPDALLAHTGFGTIFNACCALCRDQGGANEAARLGAAPWHLAMLSTGLLVMELGAGVYDGTDAFQ